MKRDFSYFNSGKAYLLLFFGLLFSTGCSFKTIVHPYPQEFEESINSYKDDITLHKDGKIKYLPNRDDSEVFEDLNYKEGALYLDTGRFYRLKKEDQFSAPFSGSGFIVTSEAYFDDQLREDVFKVILRKKESSEHKYIITGTSQNATIARSDSINYQIIAKDFWPPSVKKVKAEDSNEWHHYPLGGSWDYIDQSNERFLIVQGSPVKKRMGAETNYGQSFTLFSNTELSDEFRSEFIIVFLGYWHLTNIQYYYEECDFEDLSSDACPGSVIIK
ncbi:MAG: hypothetical protein JJ958_03045 [Balneola sp.]|nr:hypothetical protein [Balneola sp.]